MAAVNVFVAARGNQFMTDIAGWIVEAAALTGRTVELIDDRLPSADGSINLVVAPHEFFELFKAPRLDLQCAAAASVCINTEQPGTSWFRLAVDACRRGLLTLDISDQGVAALRGAGVAVERLRLGGVPSMQATHPSVDRPIDVLFMGGLDDRRGAALAELAPHLWRRHTDIRLVGGDRPIHDATPQTVFGAEKYDLLSSAKLLLNIHRDRPGGSESLAEHPPYFEWARAVEAIAQGCVVITEPSEGCEPLVAGAHFVEATVDEMAGVIDELLEDEVASCRHRCTGSPDRLRRTCARELIGTAARPNRIGSPPPSRRSHQLALRSSGLVARGAQSGPAPGSARTVSPVPADPGHGQAHRHGRERGASTPRCRGVRTDPRQPPAHRADRDPRLRRRRPGGQCGGLALQLRRCRDRHVDQHRRQRRREVRDRRRRRPCDRRQPCGGAESSSTIIRPFR